MNIAKNNKKLVAMFVFICVAICLFSTFLNNPNTTYAYANEQESEGGADEHILIDQGEVELLNGGKTNDDVVMIEGTNGSNFTKTRSRDSLSETKYIANANYFLINPKQRKNDGVDNSGGTCTTVAMQMLLGYHNYYSDRRIIPSTYLDPDYGNINSDPFFDRKMIGGKVVPK